jgi:uncharacterized protein (TIGR02271 family)
MINRNDIDRLTGATVLDRDGDKVGTVKQVYVSDDGSQPLFVTVHTGLFGTKETFVPLQSAQLEGSDLRVAYEKDAIKHAPNVDADGAISDEEQGTLFDYYDGRAGGTPSGVGDRADRTAKDGYDTSGPTTDDAMTRSEERLDVGTQRVEAGRVRLRKHVVTEQQSVNVPTSHEEIRVEREPITDANRGAAYDGPELSEEEHEVVLNAERPVVEKETVPVERVRLGKQAVTENQQVTEDVRSERIDTDGVGPDRV